MPATRAYTVALLVLLSAPAFASATEPGGVPPADSTEPGEPRAEGDAKEEAEAPTPPSEQGAESDSPEPATDPTGAPACPPTPSEPDPRPPLSEEDEAILRELDFFMLFDLLRVFDLFAEEP